ncbi:MAG: DUF805 domain-containing protein [Alphaproteobacteria bacterium]
MGFVDAVKSFYGRYVDFGGRSARSEYWWVQLFYVIAAILLSIPLILALGATGGEPTGSEMIWAAPLVLFVLAGILPMIAVTVRRFHDQDKSGWFYLLGFIPYVGGIVIIVFMCLKGTDGPNRFGYDPLGGHAKTFD